MRDGANQAHSSTTSVVRSLTSVACPPMTPATPTTRAASAITVMPSSSVRSTPSSVTMLLARRGTAHHDRGARSLARSKACSGWPSSSMT